MKYFSAFMFGLAVQLSGSATPQAQQTDLNPVISVDGVDYYSWRQYTSSAEFQLKGLRCGIPAYADRTPLDKSLPPSDCAANNTNPTAAYAPTFFYDIQVVVHIITNTSGVGAISNASVASQIQILNEDFQAIAGSNGAPGTDTQFRFRLATLDPNGNPTSGITRSANNTWFNDGGGYFNTLAWDTNRYLNIYTNLAGGNLGYVPGLPQSGLAGANFDRVVVLWSSFGLNGPIGAPYDKGRTTTHEVGHYLGLEHTFNGACNTGNCYQVGDLICDTNSELSPNFGCPGSRSTCGSLDPIDNYMDYSDDLCMSQFTPEQTRRMRCSIQFYRPNLNSPPSGGVAATATQRNGLGVNPVVFSALNTPIIGTTWNASITSPDPNFTSVMVLAINGPANGPVGENGQLLFVTPFQRRFDGMGSHSLPIPNNMSLVGRLITTQGAVFDSSGVTLTNAIDLVIGDI